jgi:hypothetical protein
MCGTTTTLRADRAGQICCRHSSASPYAVQQARGMTAPVANRTARRPTPHSNALARRADCREGYIWAVIRCWKATISARRLRCIRSQRAPRRFRHRERSGAESTLGRRHLQLRARTHNAARPTRCGDYSMPRTRRRCRWCATSSMLVTVPIRDPRAGYSKPNCGFSP